MTFKCPFRGCGVTIDQGGGSRAVKEHIRSHKTQPTQQRPSSENQATKRETTQPNVKAKAPIFTSRTTNHILTPSKIQQKRPSETQPCTSPSSKRAKNDENVRTDEAEEGESIQLLAQLLDAKKIVCDVEGCGAVYWQPDDFAFHQATHNTTIADLEFLHCSFPGCPEAFDSTEDLEFHERRHNGLLDGEELINFRCSRGGCGASFDSSEDYEYHLLFHDNEPAEKERFYRCTFEGCGAEFESSDDYAYHMNIHSAGRSLGLFDRQ